MMSPLLEADCKTITKLNDYPCTCEGNEEAKMDTLPSSVLRKLYKTDTWCQEQAGRRGTISFNSYTSDVLLLFMNYGCSGLTDKACLYHKLF